MTEAPSANDLRGLRLAILAPISYPVPPDGYGPWERVAGGIAAGMHARGLEVTLFASGNSHANAEIVSVVPFSLSEDPNRNSDVATSLHAAALFARAAGFDLVHNNFDWKPLTYALATREPPLVTTVHGFSSPPVLGAYYAAAERSFYCSISDADRDPGLDYLATTYNGIDPEEFTFVERPGDYLVALGRLHEEKGIHLAIELAQRTGRRLYIAAIPQDEVYYQTRIAPFVDGDRIRFLGAVGGAERNTLLGGALALVHLTTRPERFGLVLVEAMACGTPVLGARMGSIPEIVVDGVTGFLCDNLDEASERIGSLAALDRHACRARVEAEFSTARMIDRYCDAYRAALRLRVPPAASAERLRWRAHDWWDRPEAFTDLPPRPRDPAI